MEEIFILKYKPTSPYIEEKEWRIYGWTDIASKAREWKMSCEHRGEFRDFERVKKVVTK